jgi:putative oligomerization/nucleic acid binding protein
MLRRRPIARRAVRTAAVVGTAAAVGHHAARSSQQAQATQQAPLEAEPVAEPPAASVGLAPEDIEGLKQLADLKDQGVLTEEEFADQKAKILGS